MWLKRINEFAGTAILLTGMYPTDTWTNDYKEEAISIVNKNGKLGGGEPVFPPERKKVKLLNCVQLFGTLWTVAYQAPPSMGFSRQEYWSGLLFPSPGNLPDPGIEPRSPAL